MDKKRRSRQPKGAPGKATPVKGRAASSTPSKTPSPAVKRGRGRPPGSGKKKVVAEDGVKASSPAPKVDETPQKNGTSGPECDRCARTFATDRGLKLHQRRSCRAEENSAGLPMDALESSSDSDSDVGPLGRAAVAPAGPKRRSARVDQKGASASDGLGAQMKGRLQSRLGAGGGKPLLSCQRCGLGYDPKRDGPRCKHCTRDNEEDGDSEEDKASDSPSPSTPRSWQEQLYGWNWHEEAFAGLFAFTAGKPQPAPPLNVSFTS